jgi:hypothetical protein
MAANNDSTQKQGGKTDGDTLQHIMSPNNQDDNHCRHKTCQSDVLAYQAAPLIAQEDAKCQECRYTQQWEQLYLAIGLHWNKAFIFSKAEICHNSKSRPIFVMIKNHVSTGTSQNLSAA